MTNLRITILYVCIFLALLSAAAQSSFAQDAGAQPNALQFDNNFLVTGDYAVGGVGLVGLAEAGGRRS